MKQTCGLIAIVGPPNAGKSTLTNALVGQKISIVTPKVQTTRFCVRGVLCEGDAQAVLVDTPGIFDAKQKFEQSLVKEAYAGAKGVDALALVLDATWELREETHDLITKLTKRHPRAALVLNKVDKIKKPALLALTSEIARQHALEHIFMLSAKTGDGLQGLKTWLFESLTPQPWLYPEDQLSDWPMRNLAAEITREKLFLLLREELPYHLTVVPEDWEEKKGVVVIKQAVIVTRENHKKMVIGKGGETIKRAGEAVRRALEPMLGKKVHLTLFVKVDEKWQDKTILQGMHYEG
jgi:GTPase